MVWDEEMVRSNVALHYHIVRLRPYILMADVIRLFALAEFGGMYLDLDVGCGGSVDVFLKHDKIHIINTGADIDGCVGDRDTRPNNWMIASPCRNELMESIANDGLKRAMTIKEAADGLSSIAGPNFLHHYALLYPEQFFLVGYDYVSEVDSIQRVFQPKNPTLVHMGEHTWNGECCYQSSDGSPNRFDKL